MHVARGEKLQRGVFERLCLPLTLRHRDQEIAPLPTVMRVENRETRETTRVPVTLEKDEGNRP